MVPPFACPRRMFPWSTFASFPGKKATVDAVNDAIRKASKGKLKGVLGVNDAELVSIDFNHSKLQLHL